MIKVLGFATALALGSTAAFAQHHGPLNDVFAGYSMLASDGETMHGWDAALAWGVWGPSLGLLFDASGHQGSDAEGTDLSVFSAMAGPRVTFGSGRLRPFLHVIGGVVRSKASVTVFDIEIAESSTDFGGAAGGGFDLGFGGRWALRLAGDYRAIRADGETLADPRFSAGVAYRFGTR